MTLQAPNTAPADAISEEGNSLPLEAVEQYGTPQCARFRKKIFRRHPSLSQTLAREYLLIAERVGYRTANCALRDADLELRLGNTGLSAACGDEEIAEYAKAKSRNMERDFTAIVQRTSLDIALDWAIDAVTQAGLTFPLDGNHRGNREKELSAMARVCAPEWWRRQLRPLAARKLEHFYRSRGYVSRHKSPYISRQGLARHQSRSRRNRRTLADLEVLSNEGDVLNLAEVADASVSNPELRRNELMTRLNGYEGIAQVMGFEGLFLTLTCPSKYHPVHSGTGRPNKRYNGTTPREAQDYLNAVWATIRAAWHRAGIRVFGFRIAEPHHDGTPHWHLLVFINPDDAPLAWEIFRTKALAEDGDERGAQERRAVLERIDPNKGSAAGYIAKYISKNIDAVGVGTDFETGAPGASGAQAAVAWASTWGIRQFQPIGNTSVTVWRELRRLRDALPHCCPEKLEAIRAAADAGDWATFVELMGGALVSRDGQTLRAWMVTKEEENAYAETVERIKGVVMRGTKLAAHFQLPTRTKTWSVRTMQSTESWPNAPPHRGGLDLCQ
ncbi:replication endonuclease [Parahaliea mediterranea]|uniref:Replication endonuclease n=1 Tax=Parahaliea mediterranea TaxID=651086 RepID=A0A939IK67_9GAMM|nr:replication endonuclease [Parahaliea mediterranea]MBN7798434.1 replication endonuclease [Parahaliea mediterranea]